MSIEAYIAIFVLCLLAEALLSGLKRFYWGLILPIAVAVVFFITLDESFYELLVFETLLYIAERAVVKIVNVLRGKRKLNEEQKSKIEDL